VRAKQFLPGSEGMEGRRRRWGETEGMGEGGSNDPIIVSTYE
jgi:hypothetical protein